MMGKWTDHVDRWRDCQRCPLGGQRDRICLARGVVPCDVLFVGEAPGASEDVLGLPFEGPAGNLLDRIIERALPAGVTCALTNLVACFPREAKARGENEPERGEILECRPRLVEFVNIAQPRLIVCVGGLSGQYAKLDVSVPVIDIVHPAHILARMPLAQKHGAVRKCVVQVRCAVDDALTTPRTEWKPWGTKYASSKATDRRRLTVLPGDDGIPF